MVEDHYRIRESVPAASDERRRYIHADQLDQTRVQAAFHRLDEAGERFFSLAFGDVDHSPAAKVVEEGHVAVAFGHSKLVYRDLVNLAQVDVLPRHVDVVLKDPPDRVLTNIQMAGDAGHGHLVAQCQHHRFDVKRESRIRSSPGELDLFYSVPGAFRPRNTGVKVGLIFEEIEMSPGTLAGVVDLAQRLTIGAREPCPSFEVDEDVQSFLDLVQLHFAHEPWGFQPQKLPGKAACRPRNG